MSDENTLDDYDGVLLFITTKVSQQFIDDFASKCLSDLDVSDGGSCWDLVEGPEYEKRRLIQEPPIQLPKTLALDGKSHFEVLEIFRKKFADEIPGDALESPFSTSVFAILDAQSLEDGRVLLVTDMYDGPGARETMLNIKEQERAENGAESDPSDEDEDEDGSETKYKNKNIVFIQKDVTARRIRFEEALNTANLVEEVTVLSDIDVTDDEEEYEESQDDEDEDQDEEDETDDEGKRKRSNAEVGPDDEEDYQVEDGSQKKRKLDTDAK